MKKIILFGIVSSGVIYAGGYKIPEQSLNSMALAGAYVAHTTGADTAYFNPANMSFLDNKNFVESGITLAHLPQNKYNGVQALSAEDILPASNKSEEENLPIPYFHFVSSDYDGFRFGLSATVPAGLTKRWKSGVQKLFAEEFTLKVIELNPSVSYKVSDKFSLATGLRIIYSEGIVKSNGFGVNMPIARDMDGDTVEFGYNLAMSYQLLSDLTLAVTYRSKIELKEEGNAKLTLADLTTNYDTSVIVPLPAALNISISKTFNNNFTLELNYEKTYWSAYKTLDFKYNSPLPDMLVSAFDAPKTKLWEDTNTLRVGLSWDINSNTTLMLGYAYDETPIPTQYLSYELPDNDANIFSAGIRIKQSDEFSWGIAVLYDKKDDLSIGAGENANGIIGEFTDGGAVLATIGLSYKF